MSAVPLMRHTGQLRSAGAHVSQQHRCPHPVHTTAAGRSMHTTHVPGALSPSCTSPSPEPPPAPVAPASPAPEAARAAARCLIFSFTSAMRRLACSRGERTCRGGAHADGAWSNDPLEFQASGNKVQRLCLASPSRYLRPQCTSHTAAHYCHAQ